MTVADKLEAAKDALQFCKDSHPESGIIQRALAEFPDPDAMGVFYQAAVWAAGHCTEDGNCLECVGVDEEHDEDCMVGIATAAIGKLNS